MSLITQPMLEIKVTDGRAGEGPPWMLHFDHAEIEGIYGVHVRRSLSAQRLTGSDGHNDRITQLSGETVVAQDVGSVTLASGQTLKAKLIIGADGRTSGTATRAGIKRTGWATAKPQSFARWGTKKPRRNHCTSSLCPRRLLLLLHNAVRLSGQKPMPALRNHGNG
jgi:2-octaprenyl-6-methoxyphenol hydroxylase